MKKKDITKLSDIYSLIIEQADGAMPQSSSDAAYDKLGQNLRENNFTTTSGEPIVVFYTKKISDTEPDILHRADGPAVTFGSGGEGNEFYFIDNKLVEKDSKEFRAAQADLRTKVSFKDTEAAGLGGFDF